MTFFALNDSRRAFATPSKLLRNIGVIRMLPRLREWLWAAHHLSCREATRLAARENEGSLTFRERCQLATHTALCVYCARYRRHLRFLRKWMRHLDVADASSSVQALSTSAASRIKTKLDREISRIK
jgi:hypothetical protein